MAQKKLALGSALGFIELVITTIMAAIRKHGEEAIFSIPEDKVRELTKQFVGTLIQAGKPIEQLAENYYKVLVDYGQTLQQMIANGKYDYANSDINASNFPTQGSGQQNIVVELVHFGRDMASEAVLKEFEARGLRAATLPELLAFGSHNREKQREFPIIALGSVWRSRHGRRYVPCLCRDGSERRLSLFWFGDWWFDYCRFAAVRK